MTKTTRRDFLKSAAMFFAMSLVPMGINGWAAGFAKETSDSDKGKRRKRLVVLFQRGAVDGLSVVIPHGTSSYYYVRPTIAIPSHGNRDSALDLDGLFGLHPMLTPILPLWKTKSLAFVHACGSPDPTRSHFDAQNFMESGTPEFSIHRMVG